jgi:Carboxypeptidase regulatory-like domain/TonB dependent receptor
LISGKDLSKSKSDWRGKRASLFAQRQECPTDGLIFTRFGGRSRSERSLYERHGFIRQGECVFKKLIPTILSFCAATTSLPAQQSLIYAVISGRVTDATGTAVSGATVTVMESQTLTSQSITSDRNGRFRFAHLPNGQYAITVHQVNYRDTIKTLSVHAGDTVDEPVSMWAPDTIKEFREIAGSRTATQLSTSGLLHGDIYGLSGNSLANWNAVQAPVSLPLTEYGAALGGHANRSAYFLSLDRERLGLPADASLLKALGGRVESPAEGASFRNSGTSSEFLARLDHHFSERDTTDIRLSRATVTGWGPRAGTPGLKATQQNATIGNSIAISPSTVNETKGQFITVAVQVPAGEPAWGIASGLPTARRFKVYEAADNISRQMGRQALHAGGDFLFNQMSVSFMEGSLGSASFSQSSRTAGVYAQNQWRIGEGLEFTAGIRYDLEFLRNVRTDTNNLAPQSGFAWSPGGSRTTVIRGGYGLMYEQLPLPVIAGAPEGSVNALNLVRAGTFRFGPNSLPASALGSFTTVNPGMQNAYAEMGTLGFEHQVGIRTTLSATYQHVRGVELAQPASNEVALCAASAGCATGNEFLGGRQYSSGSRTSYDGLTVAVAGHPVQWGDYKVAYTYAGGAASTYDTFVGDQMRRVAFSTTLHTPFNTGSRLWQHVTHGIAMSGYGDFTRRDELPGLDFIHLNAQLTRSFQVGNRTRLEVIARTSDMLEHRNYSTARAISELGEYGGSLLSSYARFAAIGTPNGTQVGLRLTF